ncbi:OmpA family protein [Brevundimonas aurantiaca]|uniref:OmpA family protein n=1 Tax=Brevundimonas aurantiaca TaxID=74316 RepID=UPI00174C2875|nr:OmpA family protein [Brevundimonas aurantiaca]
MTLNRDRDPRTPPPPAGLRRYLPWILGAAALLIILLLLTRCGSRDDVDRTVPAEPVGPAATQPVLPGDAAVGVSSLDAYLAGTDAAPRTFAFERVHFDTGSSTIRAQDRPEIQAVAGVLNRYPNARVRLYGYADARGEDAANRTLAQARADVVRSALTAAGVDARRIEALSGGETNPVDSNATEGGLAENRRTELVVVQR